MPETRILFSLVQLSLLHRDCLDGLPLDLRDPGEKYFSRCNFQKEIATVFSVQSHENLHMNTIYQYVHITDYHHHTSITLPQIYGNINGVNRQQNQIELQSHRCTYFEFTKKFIFRNFWQVNFVSFLLLVSHYIYQPYLSPRIHAGLQNTIQDAVK